MTTKISPNPKQARVKRDLAKMQMNPLSLRFTGASAHLEDAFQKDYLEQSLDQIRLSLFLAAILFAVFGILDAILIPNEKYITWTIRFAVVSPAMILVMLLSYLKKIQPFIQPLLAVLIVISGGGIIVMILIAPPPVNYSYYAGLILVYIFGYTFARAQFVWASMGAWVVVILYEIAAIGFTHTPLPVLINNNFFFISANIIGMLACYAIERYARRDFLMVQLLAAEQEKVRAANRELERRVDARTEELKQINRDLAIEISERQRTETERVRLADQLKRSEKMEAIGSMAAGVAHDLNNILSGLVSYPDLLLMDMPIDSPMRQPIVTIKKSGDRAAAIVQDLLTLARRNVSDLSVVNINRLVSDYFASPECLSLKQQHPHVRFKIEREADLLNVLGSPVHLAKALMNLVGNAVEAMLVEGEVSIQTINCCLDQPTHGYETIVAGDYAIIRVTDEGVGIAPEDLKHIFEPFFTKKRMGRSGTGLGMSVVWATVKDAGGYIDIHSREGQGTSFFLYFPITRQEAEAQSHHVTIDDYRGSERVLVVDDLAEQRRIATSMLSKLGYQVVSKSSGEATLDYLQEHAVDIVVLDMIMDPSMDGCETYRRIIERHPGQKAIVASGFSESERIKEIQKLGAGEYIKKPYTLEKIGLAVRRELDRNSVKSPSD